MSSHDVSIDDGYGNIHHFELGFETTRDGSGELIGTIIIKNHSMQIGTAKLINTKNNIKNMDSSQRSWDDRAREDLGKFLERYPVCYLDGDFKQSSCEFYRSIWEGLAGRSYIASSYKTCSVSGFDSCGFSFKTLAAIEPFECVFDTNGSYQWHLLLKMDQFNSNGFPICSHPILAIIGRAAGYILERPDKESVNPYVVMFYYHATDQKVVDELLDRCKTREKEVSPKISYLCRSQVGFYYKETDVIKSEFDFANYNEDFVRTDEVLTRWADKQESCGLTILHGKPGTGKTYYLRHLAGYIKNLTYIPSGIAHDIGNPEFISFLSDNPNRVFIIEDAEGVLISNGNSRSSALQNLLNAADGLMGDIIKSKFIFTFNTDLKNIDKALLRPGRASLVYEFKELAPERTAALCEKLGREKTAASMTLAEIYNAEVVGAETINRDKDRIGFR